VRTSWCAYAPLLQNALVTCSAVREPFRTSSRISSLSEPVILCVSGSRSPSIKSPAIFLLLLPPSRMVLGRSHSEGIFAIFSFLFTAAVCCQRYLPFPKPTSISPHSIPYTIQRRTTDKSRKRIAFIPIPIVAVMNQTCISFLLESKRIGSFGKAC